MVTVQDTAAKFAALEAASIAALASKNVDILDITVTITLTVGEAVALGGMTFADGVNVTVEDLGSTIAAYLCQITGLAARGIDVVDASDNALELSVSQYKALGSVHIADGDGVSLHGTVADFDGLSNPVVATLVKADILDSRAALTNLTDADFAALAAKGVDSIDATDNAFSLSVSELGFLGAIQLTAGDNVTLADAGGSLGALTAGQIQALGGRGIDSLDATDNVLNLTYAQFIALGAVTLATDDTVTLTESGATFEQPVGGATSALKAQGVDAINATGPLSLSTAQFAALGLPLVGGGQFAITGSNSNDSIDGTVGSDTLKGLNGNDRLWGGIGDDRLFGGDGNDYLRGGAGRDVFVFDTAPNRTNVDKITDFNVSDDSVYLDNAVFKAIGKGTEAFPEKLSKSFFTIGSEAKDKNDHVIYDNKKGILYDEEDGRRSRGRVRHGEQEPEDDL